MTADDSRIVDGSSDLCSSALTVRLCPGQLLAMHRLPSAGLPVWSAPSASTICGSIPKNGRIALPGLSACAPGSGVIMCPPVSVCHQVSTIGQRPSPTRSEEHTSELPSLMRISYAVFCLQQKQNQTPQ